MQRCYTVLYKVPVAVQKDRVEGTNSAKQNSSNARDNYQGELKLGDIIRESEDLCLVLHLLLLELQLALSE